MYVSRAAVKEMLAAARFFITDSVMTVKETIDSVRLAMDEERGYEDYETLYMDNVIKARLDDALSWTLLHADGTLLTDGASGSIQDMDVTADAQGCVTLPENFLRVIRVRVSSWARAIMKPVSEDSAEYLMQSDPTAMADATRPQAALIATARPKLQLFPPPQGGETVSLTCAVRVSADTGDDSATVGVPEKAKAAYIYYICYLVALAYNDGRAQAFLQTAIMSAQLTKEK